jgi:hypothetical protein
MYIWMNKKTNMLRSIITLSLIFQVISALSQSSDAELVNQETQIFIKSGKLIKSISYELKINNRAGEKFTRISLPYSKLIRISKIEAHIFDNKGIIIKRLSKSDIIDKSAISDNSLYEDDFVKEFTLKNNSYPYTIFYTYQLQEDEFLHIENWLPIIDKKVPTLKATLSLEVPLNYKVFFKSNLINTYKSDTTDSQIKYSWTVSYKNIIESESYSPSYISFIPNVIIVPKTYKYDKPGSFENWQLFGDWNNDLMMGLSDLPQSEKNNIQNLIRDISDTRQKIKKLYSYLQDHTRYINITIETGGLKPYPASYVAENKYGDCKALSNYFKAILEFCGIKSYYTKVNAGEPIIQIDKNFPSQQFNHIILCVPILNDTIWLDCTSDGPFNYLGTFTQNRDVLLIEKNESHFSKTPSLTFEDVVETRRVKIKPTPQNQALAVFNNSFKGEKYESLYYLAHSIDESNKSKIFRNNFVEDGFELIEFSMSDPNRNSPEIFSSYSANSSNIYKTYGNDLLIHILPFSIPQFEDIKTRKLPVQIDYPIYKVDSLVYELPIGYSVTSKLLNQAIISEFGNYEVNSIQNGNRISIIKSFQLNSGQYPIDKYRDLFSFISKVIDDEKNNIIVTSKQL